ncbi:MAG: MFS transporter, partial [Actinobacteria bacterium]|nr:MFS transporter [Actinomycetota bacterium]
MVLLAIALALLGLGWNFGLLAGTAMVTDAVPPAGRAIVQGRIDLLVALSGATGGLGSGFVVASSSYAVLSLIGSALALTLIPLLAVGRRPATAT